MENDYLMSYNYPQMQFGDVSQANYAFYDQQQLNINEQFPNPSLDLNNAYYEPSVM